MPNADSQVTSKATLQERGNDLWTEQHPSSCSSACLLWSTSAHTSHFTQIILSLSGLD